MKGLFFGVGVTGLFFCYIPRQEVNPGFLALAMMPVGYYFFALLKVIPAYFGYRGEGRSIPITPEQARRLFAQDVTDSRKEDDNGPPTGFRPPQR